VFVIVAHWTVNPGPPVGLGLEAVLEPIINIPCENICNLKSVTTAIIIAVFFIFTYFYCFINS
jgi:hypothetical protein